MNMRSGIAHKLGGVVALLGALALLLSLFAFWQSRVGADQKNNLEAAYDFALRARGLAQSVQRAAIVANDVLSSNESAEVQRKLATLQRALDGLREADEALRSRAGDRMTEAQKTKLALAVQEFVAYQNDTVQLGLTISPKAALVQANDESTVANRERMVADMEAFVRGTLESLSDDRRADEARRRRDEALTLIVPGVATLLAILAAIWVVETQIRGPLATITFAMKRASEQEFDGDVPFVERRDEIGDLARALRAFEAAALETRRLEKDAEAQRRLAAELREANDEERRRAADHQAEVVAALARGLERLSCGDFTFRLDCAVRAGIRALCAPISTSPSKSCDG